MKLTENIPFSPTLVETLSPASGKLDDGRVRVTGRFQHADKKNRNNRVYPRSCLENNLKPDSAFMEALRNRSVLGQLEHPDDGKSNLGKAAILITDVRITESGEVIGTLETLSTPDGKIAAALFKDGVTVGISSRGQGSLSADASGADVVQEDFVLETFDLVADPSTIGAQLILGERAKHFAELATSGLSLTEAVSSEDSKAIGQINEAFLSRFMSHSEESSWPITFRVGVIGDAQSATALTEAVQEKLHCSVISRSDDSVALAVDAKSVQDIRKVLESYGEPLSSVCSGMFHATTDVYAYVTVDERDNLSLKGLLESTKLAANSPADSKLKASWSRYKRHLMQEAADAKRVVVSNIVENTSTDNPVHKLGSNSAGIRLGDETVLVLERLDKKNWSARAHTFDGVPSAITPNSSIYAELPARLGELFERIDTLTIHTGMPIEQLTLTTSALRSRLRKLIEAKDQKVSVAAHIPGGRGNAAVVVTFGESAKSSLVSKCQAVLTEATLNSTGAEFLGYLLTARSQMEGVMPTRDHALDISRLNHGFVPTKDLAESCVDVYGNRSVRVLKALTAWSRQAQLREAEEFSTDDVEKGNVDLDAEVPSGAALVFQDDQDAKKFAEYAKENPEMLTVMGIKKQTVYVDLPKYRLGVDMYRSTADAVKAMGLQGVEVIDADVTAPEFTSKETVGESVRRRLNEEVVFSDEVESSVRLTLQGEYDELTATLTNLKNMHGLNIENAEIKMNGERPEESEMTVEFLRNVSREDAEQMLMDVVGNGYGVDTADGITVGDVPLDGNEPDGFNDAEVDASSDFIDDDPADDEFSLDSLEEPALDVLPPDGDSDSQVFDDELDSEDASSEYDSSDDDDSESEEEDDEEEEAALESVRLVTKKTIRSADKHLSSALESVVREGILPGVTFSERKDATTIVVSAASGTAITERSLARDVGISPKSVTIVG